MFQMLGHILSRHGLIAPPCVVRTLPVLTGRIILNMDDVVLKVVPHNCHLMENVSLASLAVYQVTHSFILRGVGNNIAKLSSSWKFQ